nr:hypothetical protein HK105_007557 [Polyrhizophydium stewartii]
MFDHVFCNWITPFLRKGMAKTIESHDLWDLRDSDRAENVLRVFERSRCVAVLRLLLSRSLIALAAGNDQRRSARAAGGCSKPGTRLYWRLFAAFWPLFFSNAFFCVVVVVLDYMPSILTNLLLQLIANANSGDEDRDPSIGRVRLVAGILMSLGFVASGIMQSLLELQIFCYQGRRAGLHIRSVLTTLIFNKSLRLASAGQQPSHQSGKDNNNNNKKGKNNTAVSNNNNPSKDKDNDIKAGLGKIVTLMSVDANQFQETFSLIVFLSLAPARIFVSVAALYSLLGWPALASVGLTIVTSPFVSLVTRFQHKMISKYLRTMDRRISNVNEMLQGIRIIKFFGWEAEFQKKIEKSRDAELRSIIGVFISQALSNLVWEPIPLLISFLTFSLYAGPAGGKLDAPLVFTSLALIMTLRYPVNDIPRISMNLNQMWVSLRRIEDYLNLPELDKFQPDKQHLFESDWNEISTRPGFRNATFTWDSDAKADAETAEAQAAATEHDPLLAADSQPPSLHHHFVLSDVHVTFPVGCLTAVVGVTGAGKSSIAQALLGEMTMLRGRTVFPSVFSRGAPDFGSRDTSVAYVAQTAWLQNASVRDNILFGAPFDEQRYNHVIEACALVRDLATFPAGDMTEIGEKGINMSGGQKQRISLARACYSAAQFVILDDPLSAVDAPTALHLFDKCIRGILRGRTVVLVTHATGLVLPSADHVVYVKNGRIAAHGSGVDMQQQLEELDDSFGEHLLRALRGDKVDGSVSHSAGSSTQQAADPPADDDDAADSGKHDASGRLVEKETKQSGSVDPAVYLSYLRAVGGIGFIGLYLFVAALGRGAQVADDWWLKIWAEAYKTTQDTTHANVTIATSLMIQTARSAVTSAGSLSMSANDSTSGAAASPDSGFYIGVYGALGLGVILLDQMVIVLYSVGSYRASKTMHNAMLARILNAPMRFFDTTPVGRILNRFSNDIESIDTEVSGRARELLHSILLSLCSLGVAAVVSPFLPLLFIPVGKRRRRDAR